MLFSQYIDRHGIFLGFVSLFIPFCCAADHSKRKWFYSAFIFWWFPFYSNCWPDFYQKKVLSNVGSVWFIETISRVFTIKLSCFPRGSKASTEVTNYILRKNTHTHLYVFGCNPGGPNNSLMKLQLLEDFTRYPNVQLCYKQSFVWSLAINSSNTVISFYKCYKLVTRFRVCWLIQYWRSWCNYTGYI